MSRLMDRLDKKTDRQTDGTLKIGTLKMEEGCKTRSKMREYLKQFFIFLWDIFYIRGSQSYGVERGSITHFSSDTGLHSPQTPFPTSIPDTSSSLENFWRVEVAGLSWWLPPPSSRCFQHWEERTRLDFSPSCSFMNLQPGKYDKPVTSEKKVFVLKGLFLL